MNLIIEISKMFSFFFKKSKDKTVNVIFEWVTTDGNGSVSTTHVVNSRKNFLKLAAEWYDNHGTHYNDFDTMVATIKD